MLDSITFSTYSKLSQMTQVINSFITQASIAKANINSNINYALSRELVSIGIGKNINLLA